MTDQKSVAAKTGHMMIHAILKRTKSLNALAIALNIEDIWTHIKENLDNEAHLELELTPCHVATG